MIVLISITVVIRTTHKAIVRHTCVTQIYNFEKTKTILLYFKSLSTTSVKQHTCFTHNLITKTVHYLQI